MEKEIIDLRLYLTNLARKRIIDRDAVDDIVQDTIIKAINKHTELENQDLLKNWISRILYNEIISYLRFNRIIDYGNNKAIKFVNIETIDRELYYTQEDNIDNKNLFKCLNDLSDTNKSIVNQFYFQNKTQEDIAKQIGISTGAVKLRLFKTRKKIKKHLASVG